MKSAVTVVVLLASALPFAAAADEPRYTYLEGGYQFIDIDVGGGVDVDGDGFGIGGSVSVTDHIHLLASYSKVDLDFGIDASEYSVGVGGRLPVGPGVHLTGSVGWAWAKLDTPFGDFDDDGIFLSGGVRWMATERVELNGELTYVDLDDAGDDTTLSIGLLFHLTPDLALGIGALFGDDVTGYQAGLRYYFPGTR
jgi:hypothetical protein